MHYAWEASRAGFLEAWFLVMSEHRGRLRGTRQRRGEQYRRYGRLTAGLGHTVGRSCLRATTSRDCKTSIRNWSPSSSRSVQRVGAGALARGIRNHAKRSFGVLKSGEVYFVAGRRAWSRGVVTQLEPEIVWKRTTGRSRSNSSRDEEPCFEDLLSSGVVFAAAQPGRSRSNSSRDKGPCEEELRDHRILKATL